jgi:hypothetical protein
MFGVSFTLIATKQLMTFYREIVKTTRSRNQHTFTFKAISNKHIIFSFISRFGIDSNL